MSSSAGWGQDRLWPWQRPGMAEPWQRNSSLMPWPNWFKVGNYILCCSHKAPDGKIINFKDICSGLPWWCSGWESACQCRGHGFEPWSGRIPHTAEQLGPWATTTEPAHLEPVLCNKRGRGGERPVHRDEEWPPLAATRESPRTETKTQHSHK